MTRLQQLFHEQGQSPWLDNIQRGYLTHGELAQMVEGGIRGVTSNPTIFQKAIAGHTDYDEQFRTLVDQHETIDAAYWDLVVEDIVHALALLRPVYDESGGGDGFVSIELSPELARETAKSIESARQLSELINQPNLLVKIPGTAEGIPAVRQMISEKHSINITLIFSVERYGDVIEAYLSGLEAAGGDLSGVHSVASFFVSRVDTEVDRRLDAVGSEEALALRGHAAIAQAKIAYELFQSRFQGDRWDALAARGATEQRPLWASTSTKNPAFPDTYYVDNLIGPNTVNTMPDATIAAFQDHGTIARTIDADLDRAHQVMADLERVGVDMADVSRTLEEEGVTSFVKSYEELLATLQDKAAELSAG